MVKQAVVKSDPAWRQAVLSLWLAWIALAGRALAADTSDAPEPPPFPGPADARACYNTGTQALAGHHYAAAETWLRAALATQDERLRPPAMYNLGCARFATGVAALKSGPDAPGAVAQSQAALADGQRALADASAALADGNLDQMAAAYFRGRGARHDLFEAEKALRAALKTYAVTLQTWQRASADFSGARELNPGDADAAANGRKVDEALARLVDSLRRMQSGMAAMQQQRQQLGQALRQLKGRLPAPDAPPGPGGDDPDDDEDGTGGGVTPEELAGRAEGPAQSGETAPARISPEEAARILDGLSLDGGRRLSMSDQQGAPTPDRKGRIW